MALKVIHTIEIGRPDNECKIKIGTGVGSQHLFFKNEYGEFFEGIDDFFFSKLDLLNYLEDAKEEFFHPSENYHFVRIARADDRLNGITTPTVSISIDMPDYWLKCKKEIEASDEISYLGFVRGMDNDDAGRFYYHNNSPDSPYELLYKICIPTKQARSLDKYRSIYRLLKLKDTVNNKTYIHIIPIFNMKYTQEQLASFIKRDCPKEEDKIKEFLYEFFYKYSELIKSQGYDISSILEIAGVSIDYLEDLVFAVEVYIKSNADKINVYQHFANAERIYATKESRGVGLESMQQIFYGAPGTGKSHEIKKLTEGKSVIRTTFHPDSDYSTFVGCYKPTMADVDTLVVPVVVKSGISLQPPGTYKEKRITYKFVKQAFLKAYLAAWKKYADNNTNSSSSSSLTIKTSSGLYTITGADSQNVLYTRIINYRLPNGNLVTTWNEIWKNGSFIIPKGGSGRSLEQAVSKWIYDTISPCKKEDFEKGLGEFIQKIKETGEVVASKNTQNGQKYVFSPSDDDGVFIVKTISHSSKNTVKNAFENEEDYENADEKTKKLVDKLREFDDDFETAWNRLAEAVEQNETVDTTKDTVPEPDPQFLIIEEINRGNCAQIFGDLFQLLDRSDNNFSEYPIEADTDLQQEIERAFTEPGEYQLDNDIYVEGVVENYTSNYNASLSEDIQHGRILLLPSNLYIWATMNTSDQSLFPIDSAFKRRWEWKYVPIVQGYDQNTGTLLDWDIEVDNKTYKWWKFLQAINKHIGDITKSEDKKLGFFFCKATNSTISAETFVSKVLFYLWNDVYKDYDYSPAFFRDENKRLIEFSEYYEQDSNNNTVPNDKLIQAFIEKVEPSFKTPAADENPD